MPEPWKVWNAILERASSSGMPALTAVERAVTRTNAYLCDLDTGGLSSALYNLSPEDGSGTALWQSLRDTAAALATIGDQRSSNLLFEAAALLEASSSELLTWESVLANAGPGLSPGGELERELVERAEELWSLLEQFTNTHFGSAAS